MWRTLAPVVVAPTLLAGAAVQSAQSLLNAIRPLTSNEVATVLRASRKVLTGKTLRESSNRSRVGREILMGPSGRPKVVRTSGGVDGGIVGGTAPGSAATPPVHTFRDEVTYITDYTGRRARRCDGSVANGELVVQYRRSTSSNTWTAIALRADPNDLRFGNGPAFQMLQGRVPLQSGARRQIGGRLARALVAPWTPPPPDPRSSPPAVSGDPMPNVSGERPPNETFQTLWIDASSLLPLRWEVSKRETIIERYDFTYEPVQLRRPTGVRVPRCIQ